MALDSAYESFSPARRKIRSGREEERSEKVRSEKKNVRASEQTSRRTGNGVGEKGRRKRYGR